ncbi:MAG: A24 family peptidase C-terminal domain-containing protein [Candidatus Diapherotrites archaeon]|nr:A24 family peptidase C-terminal domain-containing protein [Candidatus Diapherotrites archaeon]
MSEHLFSNFFIIISLLGLVLASYTDLKTRMVSNWLVFGLFLLGIIGNIIYPILNENTSLAIITLIGIILASILGIILNFIGAWAYGDTKLLIAVSALNPIHIISGISLFPLEWIVFSILAMVPYLILLIQKELTQQKWLLPLTIISLLGIIASIQFSQYFGILAFTGLFGILMAYSLQVMFSIKKNVFEEIKKITELQEGDISAELIIEENNELKRFHLSPWESIIKLKEYNSFKPAEFKILAQPNNANGLETTEIQEIKKWAHEGKTENTIAVKKSAAMVPAMLLGYILVLINGGILWSIVF